MIDLETHSRTEAPPWFQGIGEQVTLPEEPGGVPPAPPEPHADGRRWEDDDRFVLLLLGLEVAILVLSGFVQFLAARGYLEGGRR